MLRCTSTATYNFKQGLLGLPLFSICLNQLLLERVLFCRRKKSPAVSQNADPAQLVVNFVSTDLSIHLY
jgi:hypothetical protein